MFVQFFKLSLMDTLIQYIYVLCYYFTQSFLRNFSLRKNRWTEILLKNIILTIIGITVTKLDQIMMTMEIQIIVIFVKMSAEQFKMQDF